VEKNKTRKEHNSNSNRNRRNNKQHIEGGRKADAEKIIYHD
ncbi:MAG: hypothetical protein ACI90V_008070, partial [Bacillariaceae sp.]|jgi:hypothetical protein